MKTWILTGVIFCLSACVLGTIEPPRAGLQFSPRTRSFPVGSERPADSKGVIPSPNVDILCW